MNPERTQAYRRVIQTMRDLGPSKLLSDEQDLIRSVADSLIFSSDLSEDVEAREALQDGDRLCRALVDSGRWEQITATRLANDLHCCGPERLPALEAA
jgi:hypothetical protein